MGHIGKIFADNWSNTIPFGWAKVSRMPVNSRTGKRNMNCVPNFSKAEFLFKLWLQ
jgi:hypothetical protein